MVTDEQPAEACGPACASGLCPGMYLLIALAVPPLGWWMLGRHRRLSSRARRVLVFLSGLWFGLWPLAAWRGLNRLYWAVGMILVLTAFVAVSLVVFVARRLLRRRRWPVVGRAVAGVTAGLLVMALVAGCGYMRVQHHRGVIKRVVHRPATYGPAHLDLVDGLPVLHLYGTPEEMGRQYGTILGPALRSLEAYAAIALPTGLYENLKRTAVPRQPRLPDRFRRELKALAKAADVSYEMLLTINLTPRPNCQVLLAWGSATTDGSLVFARNSEYRAPGLEDRGSIMVVWHPTDGPAQLSINLIGMIGTFNGATESGLCYGNLMVHNARERALDERGLPMQFVLRDGGDRCATADQLRDHLLSQPPIVPMMVAMADPKQAHVVELATSSRAARAPAKDYLAATFVFTGEERIGGPGPRWTRERYPRLLAWAEANLGRIDRETIKGALQATRSPPLFNLHAMVFEPARMKMQVCYNRTPAADGPYVEIDLKALFAAPPADAK